MKNLQSFIEEAINEARIYINQLSNEELLYMFWRHWAGWESNGRKVGTSSNAPAQKLENALYDRFPNGYPIDKVIIQLDEYLKEKLGIKSYDNYDYRDAKIPELMKELIEKNKEWLSKDTNDKGYKIID